MCPFLVYFSWLYGAYRLGGIFIGSGSLLVGSAGLGVGMGWGLGGFVLLYCILIVIFAPEEEMRAGVLLVTLHSIGIALSKNFLLGFLFW